MFDSVRLGIIFVLYLVGCYACWRIVSSFYDFRTGSLTGWLAPSQPKAPATKSTKPTAIVAAPVAPATPDKSLVEPVVASSVQQVAAAVQEPNDVAPIAPPAREGDVLVAPQPKALGAEVEVAENNAAAHAVEFVETAPEAAASAEVFTTPTHESQPGATITFTDPSGKSEPEQSPEFAEDNTASQEAGSIEFAGSVESRITTTIEFAEQQLKSEAATAIEFRDAETTERETQAFADAAANTTGEGVHNPWGESSEQPATEQPATPLSSVESPPPGQSAPGPSTSADTQESLPAKKPGAPRSVGPPPATKKARIADQEAFSEQASATLHRWQSDGERFCILLFALDKAAAEEQLQDEMTSGRLAQFVLTKICEAANTDAVVAQQGDHVIVLARHTELDEGKRVAERMRRAVARAEYHCDMGTIQSTISGGLAAVRADETLEQVSKRAQEALSEAINNGRDRIFFHDGQRCRAMWRTANVDASSLVGAASSSARTSSSGLNVSDDRESAAPVRGESLREDTREGARSSANQDKKSAPEKPRDEKRRAARTPLGRLHPIAPFAGNKRPKDNEYRMMECNDISSSGFSFFARHPPSWSQLVVKILGRSLIAKIVHRTRTTQEDPEKRYLVGCYFIGCLEPIEEEKA